MQSKNYDKQKQRMDVILYELNEVPWEIIDFYIKKQPKSNLASLVANGCCMTTDNEDSISFQPWRTWPTFHKSMYSEDHNSFELGQDPSTIYGENLWDVAEANGLRIGLFGPMQSWPPHQPENGGFYIPDTFSRSPETFPESMKRFQEFNLLMTKRNGFSSEADLNIRELFLMGLDILKKGLHYYSVYHICQSLIKELMDKRYKAARSVSQVLPSFDLYWKLHKEYKPNLSIFFTNHVAGMMHRYWGHGVPGYAEAFDYQVDKIFSNFIVEAMHRFDHQLGRVMKFVSGNPNTVLLIASSMGQGAVPTEDGRDCYVIKDVKRLLSKLNLGDAEEGLAMYPRTSLKFPNQESAKAAIIALQSVTSSAGLKFQEFTLHESTLSFLIYPFNSLDLTRDVSYSPLPEEKSLIKDASLPGETSQGNIACQIDDLGIDIKTRPGGGNTAYHTPEGILISYGTGVVPNQSRQKINILDVAPSILSLLDLPQAKFMQGKPVSITGDESIGSNSHGVECLSSSGS